MRTIKSFMLFHLIALAILMQSGCSKNDAAADTHNEKPGHIPGMGSQAGVPEGTPFKLPAGVSLVGEITGQDDGPSAADCVYDGQGKYVKVKMTLQHDSIGGPVTVEFPPGLVITSTSELFQGGLLIEKVVVTLPPKQPGAGSPQCRVTLLLSCLNHSKNPSESFVVYKFGPITSSPLIRDLISKLARKKIKFSEFPPHDDEWSLNEEYIQDALWSLTDGEGLTKDDLEHISDLPNK
jgi:hypothetical protein